MDAMTFVLLCTVFIYAMVVLYVLGMAFLPSADRRQ